MARSAKSRRWREESVTESALETRAWGRKLAEKLESGDCLLLIGDLGAGKTTLVQGIAEGLGIDPQQVISPSFVLIRELDGTMPLYHVDAYRIEDPQELVEVGIQEYFEKPGVVAVEWGEKVRPLAPARAIEIRLELMEEDRRRIRCASLP